MSPLSYLCAILGLAALCAAWVALGIWLRKVDPEAGEAGPRCGACGARCENRER